MIDVLIGTCPTFGVQSRPTPNEYDDDVWFFIELSPMPLFIVEFAMHPHCFGQLTLDGNWLWSGQYLESFSWSPKPLSSTFYLEKIWFPFLFAVVQFLLSWEIGNLTCIQSEVCIIFSDTKPNYKQIVVHNIFYWWLPDSSWWFMETQPRHDCTNKWPSVLNLTSLNCLRWLYLNPIR